MFLGCNILGRSNRFTLQCIESRKHFIQYHPHHYKLAKAFGSICLTIFYTLYENGFLAQGRERYSAAQRFRSEARKDAFATILGINDRNEVLWDEHEPPKLFCICASFI